MKYLKTLFNFIVTLSTKTKNGLKKKYRFIVQWCKGKTLSYVVHQSILIEFNRSH